MRRLSPGTLHCSGTKASAGSSPLDRAGHGKANRSGGATRGRRASPRWRCRAVVLHMRTNEMTRGQGAAQRELAGENCSSHNARETARILSGAGRVRPTNTKHVEHGALRLQDGSTAESTNFQRGHGHRDLERSTETVGWLAYVLYLVHPFREISSHW